MFLVLNVDLHCLLFCCQIRAVAEKEFHHGDSSGNDPSFRISDTPVVVFGSRAHLEEKALATVKHEPFFVLLFPFVYIIMVE